MGINAKIADKKQFTAKTLTNEIQTKHEEQKRQRAIYGVVIPKYQFEFFFDDLGVIMDATRLLLVFIMNAANYNGVDRQKLEGFIKDVITRFFSISPEKFEEELSNISSRAMTDEDMHDATAIESSMNRNRSVANGRKPDLLRGVLDRGRNGKSANVDSDGVGISGSKETTPDISSAMEEDADGTVEGSLGNTEMADSNEDNWIHLPEAGSSNKAKSLTLDLPRNEPFRRETYNLYCNATIYCFFRMFYILYERLLQVKRNERQVAQEIRRAKMPKPADDIQLIEKKPEDFFDNAPPDANYYVQLLNMCQDVMEQQMEMAQFEDVMRHFYLHCGWQLYGFEKLFSSLAKFAHSVASADAKEKTMDIMQLFYKDRDREETTHQVEINYRKQVEKLVKDGDLYRIDFVSRALNKTILSI